MLTRTLQKEIEGRIRVGKVMILYGPRRVGKTVLMKQITNNFQGETRLLNGEDYDVQALLAEKSAANYHRLFDDVDLLAIDEAQNIPDIGDKLKLLVDELPHLAVFVTGSSSFELQNQTGEPLVGRASRFTLLPFSFHEITQIENPIEIHQNLENRLIFGSYPEIVLQSDNKRNTEYLRDLVESYLLKDILTIDGIKNASKMRDLLQLIAFQTGSEVSYDELANTLSLSKNTVQKYLDLLSKVFIIYRLGGYARNLRKEVSKAGKWYFYDNGIRNALIGRFNPLALRDDVGLLWENFFISERIKRNFFLKQDCAYFFWKTYDRQEIDLIEENLPEIHAFELKWGDKMPKTPAAFAKAYPSAQFNVINRNNYYDFL